MPDSLDARIAGLPLFLGLLHLFQTLFGVRTASETMFPSSINRITGLGYCRVKPGATQLVIRGAP